ncbi:MAG: HlyD family type I secretion periplasmic adaptor subunit [Arenibacterium sp.]
MFGPRAEDAFVNDPARAGPRRAKSGAWALLLLVVAGISAFLLWAAMFEIEEATQATGQVVPASQLQVVQSLEGGIVRTIEIREGDLVEEGQVLMQIDDTSARAQRGELLEREAGLLAEEVRLHAEVAQEREPNFPPALVARAATAVKAEMDVLAARSTQLDREISVLKDKLEQRRAALDELRARQTKLKSILKPLREELALTEDLAARGAVPRIELLRLQSRLAELEGDLLVGEAEEPALLASVREASNEIELARSGYLLNARQRLATVGVELAMVRENLKAAEDRVIRSQLVSPMRGTVNMVSVTTLGEVVEAGRPLVEIVPVGDSLQIEANVAPRDVAFIKPGDPASVKISAYDYLVYGALEGEVVRIGADTVHGPEGEAFFNVTIRTNRTDLGQNGQSLPITPGMQAIVDIQTGKRTVLSYLMSPIYRVGSEALREH